MCSLTGQSLIRERHLEVVIISSLILFEIFTSRVLCLSVLVSFIYPSCLGITTRRAGKIQSDREFGDWPPIPEPIFQQNLTLRLLVDLPMLESTISVKGSSYLRIITSTKHELFHLMFYQKPATHPCPRSLIFTASTKPGSDCCTVEDFVVDRHHDDSLSIFHENDINSLISSLVCHQNPTQTSISPPRSSPRLFPD